MMDFLMSKHKRAALAAAAAASSLLLKYSCLGRKRGHSTASVVFVVSWFASMLTEMRSKKDSIIIKS